MYLHYVLDLWVTWWRRHKAHGDVIIVRFADDFIMGFEHEADAQRLLTDLRQRLAKFGLSLHPDKTRLVEFGRHAAQNRAARVWVSPRRSISLINCPPTGGNPNRGLIVATANRFVPGWAANDCE